MACDGSNINPVALAILNAKLPNGQFAVPSPQAVLPGGGDIIDQVPMGSPPTPYRPTSAKTSSPWISIRF